MMVISCYVIIYSADLYDCIGFGCKSAEFDSLLCSSRPVSFSLKHNLMSAYKTNTQLVHNTIQNVV